jgi:hypothetical protein
MAGTLDGTVGPTEAALADHSHGGVVDLVFGAFGEQPVGRPSGGKLRQAHRGARLYLRNILSRIPELRISIHIGQAIGV